MYFLMGFLTWACKKTKPKPKSHIPPHRIVTHCRNPKSFKSSTKSVRMKARRCFRVFLCKERLQLQAFVASFVLCQFFSTASKFYYVLLLLHQVAFLFDTAFGKMRGFCAKPLEIPIQPFRSFVQHFREALWNSMWQMQSAKGSFVCWARGHATHPATDQNLPRFPVEKALVQCTVIHLNWHALFRILLQK